MGWQAEANSFVPLPIRDGVAPSYLWLPDGSWPSLLAFLIERFPAVPESEWRDRMARGEVMDSRGDLVTPATPYRKQMRIWYYRELEAETPIPFEEQVLYMDEHLLVVDKPHFLPMIPSGRFVKETLLVRLKQKHALPDLVPIHRLDRETAGVVIFSHNRATRGVYQSMFQKRSMQKTYEALAAPMPGRSFPFVYRSRMADADKFFVMREEEGEPNSETVVDVIGACDDQVLYRLQPHTGRKHQLRLHMASLGAPILNDAFYPVVLPCKGDDFRHPLQLLARSITFTDPLTGLDRTFESARTLAL
ncbi:MAG TPA: RluA family pseudouridine synthase [Telluria sp.]|nr:RluA family pseudouridine synthase [Telluria sp.]